MVAKRLSFAQLEKRSDAERLIGEEIEVPEWNGFLFVRQMNGLEFQEIWELSLEKDEEGKANVENVARLVSFACEDEDGNHPKIDWLMKEPFVVVKRLQDDVLRINGLTDEAEKVMEKNS